MTMLKSRNAAVDVRKPKLRFAEYEWLLEPIRHESFSVVMLGVSASGASMRAWSDYLPNAVIVGVDRAPTPPAMVAGASRLRYVGGGQRDPRALAEAMNEAGDDPRLIVDDGLDDGDTKLSFMQIFPYLRRGATYAIEGLRGNPESFIKQVRDLPKPVFSTGRISVTDDLAMITRG